MSTTQPEALRLAAEAAKAWANVDDFWMLPDSDCGEVVLGAIEEGEKYELLRIDADTYGTDGESVKLAQFYAAANPGTVLDLLDERDRLHAENADLRAQLEAAPLMGAAGYEMQLTMAVRMLVAADHVTQAKVDEAMALAARFLPPPSKATGAAGDAGWVMVPVDPTPEMWKAARAVPDPNPPYPPHYALVWDAMLAAAPSTQSATQLPERDASIPAEQQGLFRKFDVRRVDGTDKPGGKHHGCLYFVLDVSHDHYARAALTAYAAACEATHPALATDLRTKWGAAPTAQSAPMLPESLTLAVNRWFAENTGLGGCSDKDVRELAELFYGVAHAGGRESVDDALAIVESFGPGIGGLNDTYARQILLAEEVKRLRAALAPAPSVLEDAARYRHIRDVPHSEEVRSVLSLQQNAVMDKVIDKDRAAMSAKNGGE